MNFAERVTYIMGIPISWNDIFNWIFLIASTFALFIAIVLQIIQLIKSWKKTDK